MASSNAFRSEPERLLYIVPKLATVKPSREEPSANADPETGWTPELTISEGARNRLKVVLLRNKGDRTKAAEDLSVPTKWIDKVVDKYDLEK